MRARALKASAWIFAGQGAQRGLALVSNLIMTRLLVPEAFGLMAMVLTVHAMVNMVADIGIRQSVTRSGRGEDLHFLRVAWTVQIMRSAVIAGVVGLIGLALYPLGLALGDSASVYADPRLPALVIASMPVILFKGMESAGMHLAARRLAMGKVTAITAGGQLITIAMMVAFAQIEASVWALLLGTLVGAALRTLGSHLLFHRQVPMRITWDRDVADELWSFGRWLIGASIAGFVVNNGDRFIMAALLDTRTFGLYVIAALWLQTGTTILNQLNSNVVYAALAETARKNRDRLLATLRRVRRVFDVLCVVGFLGGFFLGPVLIGLLYAPEYANAGVFLGLLSFRYLARRQMPLASLLLVEGQSKLQMTASVASAVAIVVGAPVAYLAVGPTMAMLVIALAPLAGAWQLLRAGRATFPKLSIRSDLAVIAVTFALAIAVYVVTDPRGLADPAQTPAPVRTQVQAPAPVKTPAPVPAPAPAATPAPAVSPPSESGTQPR